MSIDYKKLGSAVQDGKIKYLSVSSVTKFDPASMGGCPRRWYYHYVEGDKEEGTAAQELGTQIHKEIAHYLLTGQDLLGSIARQALPLLPEPKSNLYVETPIATQSEDGKELNSALHAAGVPFVGDIDLLYVRGDTMYLIDHKTTGRRKGDLPDADYVANSIQMTGYGVVAASAVTAPKHVFLAHNYIGTKTKFAIQVGKTEPAADVVARWSAKMDPLVEYMQRIAGEKDAAKVPQNTESCHAWRRTCKYATKCFVDPIEQLVQLGNRKGEDMGLNILDALKSTSAPAPKQEATIPPPAGSGPDGAFYTPQQQDIYGVDAKGQQVLPPDAPESDPAIAAEPPPLDEPLPTLVAEKAAALDPAPKKRGRPRKADVAPTPPPAVSAPAPTLAAVAPAASTVICVDCIAPGVQSLAPYVDKLVAGLAKTANVVDVRTIREKDSPLAFGGWRGVLAALARREPPTPGVYSVVSNELVDAVLEGLEASAVIARGRR